MSGQLEPKNARFDRLAQALAELVGHILSDADDHQDIEYSDVTEELLVEAILEGDGATLEGFVEQIDGLGRTDPRDPKMQWWAGRFTAWRGLAAEAGRRLEVKPEHRSK